MRGFTHRRSLFSAEGARDGREMPVLCVLQGVLVSPSWQEPLWSLPTPTSSRSTWCGRGRFWSPAMGGTAVWNRNSWKAAAAAVLTAFGGMGVPRAAAWQGCASCAWLPLSTRGRRKSKGEKLSALLNVHSQSSQGSNSYPQPVQGKCHVGVSCSR